MVILGADLNRSSRDGKPSLTVAAKFGSDAALKSMHVLIKAGATGADLNTPNSNTGATPLIEAVTAGRIGSVKLLLAAGADLAKAAHRGITPLGAAAKTGNLEMVQLLTELVDKDQTGTVEKGPLMWDGSLLCIMRQRAGWAWGCSSIPSLYGCG